MTRSLIALLFTAAACASSGLRHPSSVQRYGAYPPEDILDIRPLTRAERSNFRETSTHADVMMFFDSLRAMADFIHVTTLGKSAGGKDIPLIVMSRPLVRTPAEARRMGRPIVYLQGNIHGGEVEGKEALQSLLRDLARDRATNVIDSLILLVAPVYNVDGNEALGPQERTRSAQNGPALVGQRANGAGLDLNRDYIKAEAPETRAALELFKAWEPDVFVDLHATDGSYHGYNLTWSPPLNPASMFSGPYTQDTLLPQLAEDVRVKHRVETFPYGNFDSQDSIEAGWKTYDHRPRFGTNYYGLRGRVGILAEAYSHDPFLQRVASTYSFVLDLLSLISGNIEDFRDIGRDADRRTTAMASGGVSRELIAIRSRLTATPRFERMRVEEVVRTGDSVRHEAGLPPGVRRTGRVTNERVPVYDRFEPTLTRALPYAWIIAREHDALLEPLRRHGIYIEQLVDSSTIPVQRFTIDTVARAAAVFQGHREVALRGTWSTESMVVAAGSYVVRAGQPLGILALYLLDPQSDDGLTTWNFADSWLRSGGAFPVLRVLNRIPGALRAAP